MFLLYVAVVLSLRGVNGELNNGPFHSALYSRFINCDHIKELNYDVSKVVIYFYDFKNNVQVSYQIENAIEGITQLAPLDTSRVLIVFVPGYESYIDGYTDNLIQETFSDVSNIYLIIIDHSAYTSSKGGRINSYERAVSYVYYIGQALGKLLVDFNSLGYSSRKMHCIGHSLGAQMLGYTGEYYYEKTNEKIWRITGLDPAGPCFSKSPIENQLRSGVGHYVEIYHCNAGDLGTTSVLGDIDFFFNKDGKKQENCHAGIIPAYGESKAAKCSHKACVTYYAFSVHHPDCYKAWSCYSYDAFNAGLCFGNQCTVAGYFNPGNVTGVFYVSTKSCDK